MSMNKLEKIKVSENIKNYMNFFKTKYDNLFEQKIIFRGMGYYINGKVIKFKNDNDIYEAIVEGSSNYNVKIKIKNDKLDEVYCSCLYHKDNIYCKHIYAVLMYIKMKEEKKDLIKQYKKNYNKIKKISNDIKNITDQNEQYLILFAKSWAKDLPNFHEKYLNELKTKYDLNNDFKLISSVRDSYYFLNSVSEDYNLLLTYIEEGKIESEKEKSKENTEPDTIFTVTFDETKILDNVDETLANIDASQLKYLKEKFEENNDDTEIIDKALKERLRRDKIAEELKRKKEKEERKQMRRTLFWGIARGLSSNQTNKNNYSDLMPWEQDEINNKNYETFNFEEEEMEEDDFYYEDLD